MGLLRASVRSSPSGWPRFRPSLWPHLRTSSTRIAKSDRQEALAREERERQIQAAQRRIDDAILLLEACEQAWSLGSPLGIPGGLARGVFGNQEAQLALGHLTALLRASTEAYPRTRHLLFNAHFTGQFEELKAQAPEHENPYRWAIRSEILSVISEAREQLSAARTTRANRSAEPPEMLEPASAAPGGTSEALEDPAQAPGPETSPEVLEGPETPEAR